MHFFKTLLLGWLLLRWMPLTIVILLTLNFEQVKNFSSHLTDFEQVKNFSSHLTNFEHV